MPAQNAETAQNAKTHPTNLQLLRSWDAAHCCVQRPADLPARTNITLKFYITCSTVQAAAVTNGTIQQLSDDHLRPPPYCVTAVASQQLRRPSGCDKPRSLLHPLQMCDDQEGCGHVMLGRRADSAQPCARWLTGPHPTCT